MATTEPDADLTLIRKVEEATLAGWPSLATVVDGSWILRFAIGQTGRANSVTVLDPDDGGDVKVRMATAAALYQARQLLPLYRVTPLTPQTIIDQCDQFGYRRFNETRVLWHDGLTSKDTAGSEARIDIKSEVSDEWLDAVAAFSDFTSAKRDGLAAKLPLIAVPAAFIIARLDNQPIATVMAVAYDGRMGILDLAVAPEFRRRGLARQIIDAAVGWGIDNFARPIWLQVVADNQPAEALYKSMGFRQIYSYHYRTPNSDPRIPGDGGNEL